MRTKFLVNVLVYSVTVWAQWVYVTAHANSAEPAPVASRTEISTTSFARIDHNYKEGLRDRAPAGIEVGAAVVPRLLREDPQYAQTVARHFSSVTAENAMKSEPLNPRRGEYQFQGADEIVRFAEKHNIAVHGHTLVWYRQTPNWLKNGTWTRDEAINLLREHIYTVAGRYRGRVRTWDVVNEAIGDDLKLRDDVWSRSIGPDYIDLAFRFAHEADPGARLYYNDYGADAGGPKADHIWQMLSEMRVRGVPVHGMGFQMHIGTGNAPQPKYVYETLQHFADLGLEVAITEMDVALNEGHDPDIHQMTRQAVIYEDIIEAAMAVKGLKRIAFWGVDDCHSWIQKVKEKPALPLLFDCDYQPKPAFHTVFHALHRD